MGLFFLGCIKKVFNIGISYDVEEEVSYWGLKQIKKNVIEELFPRGYTRTLANNALLVNPLRSEIEVGISEKNREKRIKQNEETIARYRAEGKFGHQYLHQLKLVKEIAFGQAFTDKKIPVKVERAPHRLPDMVSHEKCPNCIAPVTVDQLENVYKISLRKAIGVDEAQFKSYLITVIETYNAYMEELGMNTCHNKAMFFAISHGEVGGGKIVKNEEKVSYSVVGLKKNFSNFQTKEGMKMAEQLGYDSPTKRLSGEALQKATANYAYKGINGNTQVNDGWNYRGRGLMQLTGRGNYQAQRAYILSATGVDIIKDFEMVSSDVKLSTLTAMVYFNKNRQELRFKTSGSGFYYIMQQVGANPGSDRDGYLIKQKCYEEETTKKFKVPECSYKRELRVDTTIITYHIYHSGEIYKKFPKDYVKETYNQNSKQVQYIYYTADGIVHNIGIYQWQEIDELKNAGYQDSIPRGYSETFDYPADWSIDGQTAYYYKDKDKLTSIYVKGKNTKIRKYTTTGKKSKVIQVCPIQYKSPTLSFSYKTYATIREYCGIDQFAMFIGGFATVGIDNLFEGTGIASRDGTGFPSVSHVNGQAMDMAYNKRERKKDEDDNNTIAKGRRLTSELQQFIDAMAKFGCKRLRVGTKVKNNKEYTVPSGVCLDSDDHHDDHLHIGPIYQQDASNKIIYLKEKEE
ncbi:hypothetical protein [Myroides sp. WP-1]|uniref:hypothetical protein n=1 Tax=Myroides sp. WP-1 TaxID=2759944 RepID=UPI0015F863C7|nr:hypothetical protein [Myroides sp. WP-1]MBB1141003.1 hypothetical protein [Myroides sp. WP-1]